MLYHLLYFLLLSTYSVIRVSAEATVDESNSNTKGVLYIPGPVAKARVV